MVGKRSVKRTVTKSKTARPSEHKVLNVTESRRSSLKDVKLLAPSSIYLSSQNFQPSQITLKFNALLEQKTSRVPKVAII